MIIMVTNSSFPVPASELIPSPCISSVNPHNTLMTCRHYYLDFTDKKREAPTDPVSCPRPLDKFPGDLGREPRAADPCILDVSLLAPDKLKELSS